MPEHPKDKLLPRHQYFRRLGRSILAGIALIFFSLSIGMLGIITSAS